jgi:threonyl-tRNA synthetase
MTDLQQDLDRLRHSTAHVLGQAVLSLYPDAKLGIGPAIEEGFYYDFDLDIALSESDLEKIEIEMARIISEKQEFIQYDLDKKAAIEKLESQFYKHELIQDLNLPSYSFYENGSFVDLCKGPHIRNTSEIKAFKLLKVSGAYWRGSEANKMLQRIYGTAFFHPKDLRLHLTRLEEAKKRDHRVLGKELSLFSIQEEVGGGLVLWHPNGSFIREQIESFWKKKHYKNGYQLVHTPHIGKSDLWKTSGHLDFYKENMFDSMDIENQQYFVKPMNCPFHIHIYKAQQYSYRQLPVRLAELGTVYRYERSGVLHGLFRVRGFTQDDAHIVCTKEQAHSEIREALNFSLDILKTFDFKEFKLFLSTKPKEKSVGSDKDWQIAQEALEEAIKESGLPYDVDEGGGAFYGPKIDIKIKDAIGRQWQCSTIQFDFNLPEKFQMNYVDSTGERVRPFMIHRALLGSIERFFGILIEHYAGWFPLWLAPVQFKILTVNDALNDYANAVLTQLTDAGLRAELHYGSDTIGYKIKAALREKVPFMLIIGEKEKEASTVTLRHKSEQLGALSISELVSRYNDNKLTGN